MAEKRCSNCEKTVRFRDKTGVIVESLTCAATNEDISGKKRYQPRKCDEFLPRLEYSAQFRKLTEKLIRGLAIGKTAKDIFK